MATFSDAIAVANITALKTVTATDGMIRKVTTLDATYGYPDSYFIFRSGATYTERLPGIVADNSASGFWVMFPTPLVLNAGDPGGTADLPGVLWVNTSSGNRFISNPDLSWSAIASGTSSAITTTTTSYTQPAVDANVTINVTDSSIFAVGQYVFVETGGNYEVVSKPTLSQLELRNTSNVNNAAPTTVITSGQLVAASGQSGFADPMTTAGDIIIRNGANTTTRLGVGSEGQVLTVSSGVPAWAAGSSVADIIITASGTNETLTTGTAKETFRATRAMTLSNVKASVTTAPTGSTLIVDINVNGASILSTKLSIDATEKTSVTASTPPVLSTTAIAADDEITIDIDQVGATIAGAGLKVAFVGTYA